MKSKWMTGLILGFLLSLAFSGPAEAHKMADTGDGNVITLPDIVTSLAFYQELEAVNEVHVYTFEGQKGQRFQAGINIPAIAGLENYGVSLLLLGPGLDPLTPAALGMEENSAAFAPRQPKTAETSEEESSEESHGDHGDHEADPLANLHENHSDTTIHRIEELMVLLNLPTTGVLAPSGPGPDFFEAFSQTHYWGRQSIQFNLPASGSYSLLVFHPEGESGKYVLDTGYEEVFGIGDILQMPIWWVKIRLYFGQGAQLAILGSGIALTLVGGALWLARRKKAMRQTLPEV